MLFGWSGSHGLMLGSTGGPRGKAVFACGALKHAVPDTYTEPTVWNQ
jgi:hypothetical protein